MLLVKSNGFVVEHARYSSYGVPFGLSGGDADSDGDCDQGDIDQIQSWIDASGYDPLGDVNIDGVVDSSDKSAVQNHYLGAAGGMGVLSSNAANRRGYAGYQWAQAGFWHVRLRALHSGLGAWLQRDPLAMVDGPGLSAYVRQNPVRFVDPLGLLAVKPQDVDKSVTKAKEPSKMSARECCDKAEELGEDDGDAGGVICCQGELVPCSWGKADDFFGSGLSPMDKHYLQGVITECITAHEDKHIQDGMVVGTSECEASKEGIFRATTNPELNSFDKTKMEAGGYTEEKKCIEGHMRGFCDGSAPTPICDAFKKYHENTKGWADKLDSEYSKMIRLYEGLDPTTQAVIDEVMAQLAEDAKKGGVL